MGQSQSTYQSHHFQHRFISNPHPLYPQYNNLLLLHQKLTSKIYALNISIRLSNSICKKIANKCSNLTPIQHYIIDSKEDICSKFNKYFIVIYIGNPLVKTIKHFLLEKQLKNRQPFSDQSLENSIQDICNALLYLKFINHPHGNLSTQTIYYDSQNAKFILTDPWIAPLKQNSVGQYPSPQKLQKINNESNHYDPYLSDLFSYGMIILQCMFGIPTGVYKPNYKVDNKKIVQMVNFVQYLPLKQKLKVMLTGSQQQKKNLLNSYMNRAYKKRQKMDFKNVDIVDILQKSKFNFNNLNNANYSTLNTLNTQRLNTQKNDNNFSLQQSRKNNPQFNNIENGFYNSIKKPTNISNNYNYRQPQLILNANSNNYQKFSMPPLKFPQNRFDNNIKPNFYSLNNKISQKNHFQSFKFRNQNERLSSNLLTNNKNFKATTNCMFQNDLNNHNLSHEKYSNQYKHIKNYQNYNKIHNFNQKLAQNPQKSIQPTVSHKFNFSKNINGFSEKKLGNIFNFNNFNSQLIPNHRENTTEKKQKQVSIIQKNQTQIISNSVQNSYVNKNGINFNNIKSPEKIIFKNSQFNQNINKQFQKKYRINQYKDNESQQLFNLKNNSKPTIINEKLIQNIANSQKEKNIQQIFNKQEKLEKNKKKNIISFENSISQIDSFNMSKRSQEIILQDNQNHLTPYFQNLKFTKMGVKHSNEDNSQEKQEQLSQIQTSFMKFEQSKSKINSNDYLAKTQQRIKQYQKQKKSPQISNEFEISSHSPASKTHIKYQQNQYLLCSNSDQQNQKQSIMITGSINSISENQSQINRKKQNQNQISPICNQQGKAVEKIGNLIIYEQSDDDQQNIKNRGDPVQQIYENGGRYKGYIYQGKRDGQGVFYYKDGGYYQGTWKNNMMNGYGKLYYDTGNIAYEGYWHKDQFHGRGKVYNDCPQILGKCYDYTDFENIELYWQYYEGDLVHDCKQGFGKIMLSNGQSFQGQFHNDKVDGKGVFKSCDGRVIRGIWKNSKLTKIMN